jgi:hypothetical protein
MGPAINEGIFGSVDIIHREKYLTLSTEKAVREVSQSQKIPAPGQ